MGIAALVIATFFFAAQDAITKHLMSSLAAPQIVCIRFFFFSLFAIAFAARRCGLRRAVQSRHLALQWARGFLIAFEIMVFAIALSRLGLAEMHSLFATFPLIVTVMSIPLLGEQVGWRRWIAVVVGFCGTLIILRPDGDGLGAYTLLALLAATMFALYNVLTRRVREDRFETSLLYFGVGGFAGALLFAPFHWYPMEPQATFWVAVLSGIAILGHLFLIKSLELAPAALLQPFNYLVLVWALVIGYVFFGELLPVSTLIGAALVVGSGIFIARREYRLLRARADAG